MRTTVQLESKEVRAIIELPAERVAEKLGELGGERHAGFDAYD